MEKKVFERTKGLTEILMRYCPGCGHGVIHRLVAETIEELGIRKRTIGIAPVGCSVFADEYFNCDMIQPAHGRGPAVATGMKRVKPDCIVFSYQGDGDLASIGMAETIHSAARGERITIIFVNNAIYGMTGGQMAPTTLIGMKSTTSPFGRDPRVDGYPIKMCELLSSLDAPAYLARVSVHKPANVLKAKKAIKKAFQVQIDDLGFSLVEIISQCPTDWFMTPLQAIDYVDKMMIPYYPLGEFKTPEGKKETVKAKTEKILEKV
ncbi:MAG: thiamine pyrophosphate-dependent enzyme [candidate division Zixibacteria bacterium]|nr:thiamine pyrophosphate-dependent enzyme [candidate division Zixibacteria bacterium]